jgi:hypothetical protein
MAQKRAENRFAPLSKGEMSGGSDNRLTPKAQMWRLTGRRELCKLVSVGNGSTEGKGAVAWTETKS